MDGILQLFQVIFRICISGYANRSSLRGNKDRNKA
uniref:Uncharacterized protein n=1 Tax=Rhizophora mucronata TaxID=61149 RepID=A0A2P2QJA5_RHIMU